MKIINKHISVIVIISCIVLVVSVFWLNRSVFLSTFNYDYVRHFYDHSHWSVPFSQRKMGDALLYQIAGYELVTKKSFTEINPEAPPLGKYLIAWSILFTGNGARVNFLLYFLLLTFTYLLSRRIFKEKNQRWLAVFLVAWQPLVWQQLTQTMLDLGQVTWLTGWMWCLLELASAKKFKNKILASLGAGIFLGLFVSTKIAFFLGPLGLLIGIWFILRKKLLWFLASLLMAPLVYALMYAPHLIAADFHQALSLQKWILNYWLSSHSRAVPGITLLSLATGVYLGHWQNANWTWLNTWHPTWLLGTFGLAAALFKKRKQTKLRELPNGQALLLLSTTALILSLSIVPLFDRYLLLIIPSVVLGTIWLLSMLTKHQQKLTAFIVIWTIVQTILLLPPSLHESVKEIERVASVPAYQELWYFLDAETQSSWSRDQFWEINQATYYQLNPQSIEWDICLDDYFSSWQTSVPVIINIKYKTPIGEIYHSHPTTMTRQDGRWVVNWDWQLILPDWDPTKKFVADIDWQKGDVVGKSGEKLVVDGEVSAVYVTPGLIADELKMNDQIEALTGITKPNQEFKYKIGQLPDQAVLIGPLLPDVKLSEFQLEPGISVQRIKGRVFNPEAINNPELLQKLKEIDHNNPTIYWGTLKVVYPANPSWQKVLINKSKAEVRNVETGVELFPRSN